MIGPNLQILVLFHNNMIIQTSSFENRNDQMIRIWLDLLVVLKKCAAHLEGFATAHDLFHILLSLARLFSNNSSLTSRRWGLFDLCKLFI